MVRLTVLGFAAQLAPMPQLQRAAAAGLFMVLFAPVAPASATISEALSLQELVARADHVVLATAASAHAQRDARNRIVTDYALRVSEVMKGDAAIGSTLTMRSLGGVLGDLGMRVEGEPHLTTGERYVVFLGRTSSGLLRPVGMSQGVFPVRGAGGAATVLPGGGGLSLVQRVQGGQLVPAPGALPHPLRYDELRERVDRVLERESGAVQP